MNPVVALRALRVFDDIENPRWVDFEVKDVPREILVDLIAHNYLYFDIVTDCYVLNPPALQLKAQLEAQVKDAFDAVTAQNEQNRNAHGSE